MINEESIELSVEDFSLLYKYAMEKRSFCAGLEEMYEFTLEQMRKDHVFFICIWFNLGYVKGMKDLERKIK